MQSPSSSRRRLLVVGAVLAVAAAGGWWFFTQRGPAAPRPADPEALDPEVAALVREHADALDRRRADPNRRVRLGMVYEANELFTLAERCYAEVLERYPGQAAIWFRLAACRERTGDLDGAIAALRSAVEEEEGYAAAHARLATWLLDAGELAAAEQAIEHARSLAPAAREPHFAAARLHLKRRRPQEAIAILRHLTSGPDGGYAHHLLAIAYRILGDHAAAAAAAARARQRPSFPDPQIRQLADLRVGLNRWRSQAAAGVQSGNCQAAMPVLEKLRARAPGDARTLSMLAQCHLLSGDPGTALTVLREALEADPESFLAHLNLSKAAAAAARQGDGGAAGTALVHADRALELRPASGAAHAARADALAILGRRDQALSSYFRAWKLDAREPGPLLRAGSLLLEAERWDEARSTFDGVLAVHDGHPGALFGRARAEMELGRFDEAESTLELLGATAREGQAAQLLAAARARLMNLRAARGGGR